MELFRALDRDKSGTITKDEFVDGEFTPQISQSLGQRQEWDHNH